MFERFTDRAREALALANREAQHSRSQYIGTEHILLGITGEGSGSGYTILKKAGIELHRIRIEINKLSTLDSNKAGSGRLPETLRAKRVIEWAIKEARNLGHDFVGTGHLLLGLFHDNDSVATQILLNLGLNTEEFRKQVLDSGGVGIKEEPDPATIELELQPLNDEIHRLRIERDQFVRAADYERAAEILSRIQKLCEDFSQKREQLRRGNS